VTQEKKYFIDKREIAYGDIEQVLLAETAKLNDNTVILRIPFDLQVQDLVDLLQIGMQNNLKVIIATKAVN
jgi:biopolymer transport protein ExbD